jgi:phytoene desaturase
VQRIEPGRVFTPEARYVADAVVSGLDAGRLEKLLGSGGRRRPRMLSCSGVTIYATLEEELPARLATHSVVLPSDPAALYASLEAEEEPAQTMAFVDYYRPGEPYPNEKHVLALGLTAPPNDREYGLEDPFVAREIERVSQAIGLPKPVTEYLGGCEILHPRYFGAWGSAGGALYGAVKPFWMSGPLHRPRYSDRKQPWLWRVGASVHPGGGIPAVLGGAMISTGRLLGFLGK